MEPRVKKITIILETDDGEITKEFSAKEYNWREERGLCKDYRGSKDESPVDIHPNGNYRFVIEGWTGPRTGDQHNILG